MRLSIFCSPSISQKSLSLRVPTVRHPVTRPLPPSPCLFHFRRPSHTVCARACVCVCSPCVCVCVYVFTMCVCVCELTVSGPPWSVCPRVDGPARVPMMDGWPSRSGLFSPCLPNQITSSWTCTHSIYISWQPLRATRDFKALLSKQANIDQRQG